MPNANLSARFRINGSFAYKAPAPSTLNYPASCGSDKQYAVSGSGAGVAAKAFSIQVAIAASGTYTLDLNSFTDNLGSAAVWTNIKAFYLQHDPASVAAGTVEITGAAANAIPGLRSSALLKGQESVPVRDVSGTGLAFTAPNSKIVVKNNDAGAIATVNLFLLGE